MAGDVAGSLGAVIEIARTHRLSSAPAGAFFERWCDLESHPEWAPSMEYFRLDGPFGLGARGVLKARGGEEAEFVVTALDPPHLYADTTTLDGATLTVSHRATPLAEGCRVELVAWLEGERASIYAAEMGDSVQRSLERDLASLAAILEPAAGR